MRKVETLDTLQAAFADWRKHKKHAREAVPQELLERARRLARVHGDKAVVRVARIERSRLWGRGSRGKGGDPTPSYSRFDLGAPPAADGHRPLIEVETPAGVKVRVFAGTPEVLDLVSSVCGIGGAP